MPSGYTAKLYEGEQSFKDFLWGAARGMGALVTLRESPDATIPERFEPRTDYYDETEAKAKAKLRKLDAITPATANREAAKDYEAALARHADERSRTDATRARYEAMLVRVDSWEPPTPEHEGFKQFMREQLQQSIDFDCNPYERKITFLTGDVWVEKQRASAEEDLRYAREHRAEEIKRTESRNAWLKALRESVTPCE